MPTTAVSSAAAPLADDGGTGGRSPSPPPVPSSRTDPAPEQADVRALGVDAGTIEAGPSGRDTAGDGLRAGGSAPHGRAAADALAVSAAATSPAAVAAALASDPTKLTAPVATIQDKYELLPAFLQVSRGVF